MMAPGILILNFRTSGKRARALIHDRIEHNEKTCIGREEESKQGR